MTAHSNTDVISRVERNRTRRARLRALELVEACLVLGVWLITFTATLRLVHTYASSYVPVGDDIVAGLPGMLDPMPEALTWVGKPHNEHRVPFPKLILWALVNGSGFDLRAVMYFGVGLLGLLALLAIGTARKIRGYISCSDAFFPLAVFCWAQATNFIIAWQLHLLVAAFLQGILLCLAAGRPGLLTPSRALVACLCLLLLPLSGATGVAMVPALALWIGWEGVSAWRTGTHRRQGGLMVASALTAVALSGLYFVGLELAEDIYSGRRETPPSVTDYANMALEVLSSSTGPPLFLHFGRYTAGAGMLALFVISTVALVILVKTGRERRRAIGVGLFLLAAFCLIAALTWGRAPFGEDVGAADRYYTVLLPGVFCVYLIWVIFGGIVGRCMQSLLLLLALGVFVINAHPKYGDANRGFAGGIRYTTLEIEKAVRAGNSLPKIAQMWPTWFAQVGADYFNDFWLPRWRKLREAGVAQYKDLPDAPPIREERLDLRQLLPATSRATYENGVCRMLGPDHETESCVVFHLPQKRYLWAIRFTYRYEIPASYAIFDVSWRVKGIEDFGMHKRGAYNLRITPEERTVTVIVDDTIDQFRLQPAGEPCTLYLSEIVLLVPVEAQS